MVYVSRELGAHESTEHDRPKSDCEVKAERATGQHLAQTKSRCPVPLASHQQRITSTGASRRRRRGYPAEKLGRVVKSQACLASLGSASSWHMASNWPSGRKLTDNKVLIAVVYTVQCHTVCTGAEQRRAGRSGEARTPHAARRRQQTRSGFMLGSACGRVALQQRKSRYPARASTVHAVDTELWSWPTVSHAPCRPAAAGCNGGRTRARVWRCSCLIKHCPVVQCRREQRAHSAQHGSSAPTPWAWEHGLPKASFCASELQQHPGPSLSRVRRTHALAEQVDGRSR